MSGVRQRRRPPAGEPGGRRYSALVQHGPMGLMPGLLCKQRSDMRECLEFQCIARRVQEEHSGLLADFALEADMRLDDEFDPGRREFVRCRLPLIHRQHDAEMPDRDRIAIYLTRLAMADLI